MPPDDTEVESLILRAGDGDESARGRLLSTHRARLRQMIALRLDRRLAARIDPSDVVQDALADADLEFSGYLRSRSIPFYAWLRRYAWDRLVDAHRKHVLAEGRSVSREHQAGPAEGALAERLADAGATPSGHLVRAEAMQGVRAALERLPARDREVLVLLYIEDLSAVEAAPILGISEGAVRVRHLRALERIRRLMSDAGPGEARP